MKPTTENRVTHRATVLIYRESSDRGGTEQTHTSDRAACHFTQRGLTKQRQVSWGLPLTPAAESDVSRYLATEQRTESEGSQHFLYLLIPSYRQKNFFLILHSCCVDKLSKAEHFDRNWYVSNNSLDFGT